MSDVLYREADQGALFQGMDGVLRVTGSERGDRAGGFVGVPCVGEQDLGAAAEHDPPELGPVIVVVVDQQRGLRVLFDVAEAADSGGGLGLLVDGDVGGGTAEGEDDGDQMRFSAGRGGGEMCAAGRVDAVADGVKVCGDRADGVLRFRHARRGYQIGRDGSPP